MGELLDKLQPGCVGQAADSLKVAHLSINETSGMITLHERKCPHDLRVIINKLMWDKVDIKFARI